MGNRHTNQVAGIVTTYCCVTDAEKTKFRGEIDTNSAESQSLSLPVFPIQMGCDIVLIGLVL